MVVFVGAHTHRDTPVPIPNTAVKPVGPMILLQRESRSVPALKRTPRSALGRGVLCCCKRLGLWPHTYRDVYISRSGLLNTASIRRKTDIAMVTSAHVSPSNSNGLWRGCLAALAQVRT